MSLYYFEVTPSVGDVEATKDMDKMTPNAKASMYSLNAVRGGDYSSDIDYGTAAPLPEVGTGGGPKQGRYGRVAADSGR